MIELLLCLKIELCILEKVDFYKLIKNLLIKNGLDDPCNASVNLY